MTDRRYIDTATGEEKTCAYPIEVIEQLKSGAIREAGSKPAKKEEPKVEAPKIEETKVEEPKTEEPKVESTRKAPRRRPAADNAE